MPLILTQQLYRRAHIDISYSPFTFTLNVDRRINPNSMLQSASKPAYKTRAAVKRQRLDILLPAPVLGPVDGGSSFIDVTLGVVVRQAQGTMMAIRPHHMHGTSRGYGAENSGIGITFSNRIKEAWEKADSGLIEVELVQSTDG